jgi:hypothetical protein
MPFEDRALVIPPIVPLVGRDLASADGERAGNAREVLFALRRQATTDEATRAIDGKLLPALERDLRTGRVDGGRHSVKEMLIAIGAPAAPLASRVLADAQAPFETAADVLDKVGDRAAREAGGAALVDRARGGAPLTPVFWKTLGALSGPRVIAFLQEKVERGTGGEALEAARTLGQMKSDRALLPFALKVARNPAAKPPVREEMLTLAQTLGGDEARKGLLEMIGGDPDPAYRYRAYRAVIKADAKAIVPALETFSDKAKYEATTVREQLVAPLTTMGWPAREGIFKALESRSPLARLTAVWALEKVGFESDAKAVAKLVKDRGKVKGISTTIGAEATRVVSHLKKPAS